MQVRTVGGYVPGFLESGYSICDDLDAVLKVAGRDLSSFSRLLDYGCGSGRTTRALKTRYPAAEVHGTDIDPEAIAWLTRYCSRFGEFRLGTACLLEKWYYRHSNFQNWFTTDRADPFTYVGCHYVDLVYFITGLPLAGGSAGLVTIAVVVLVGAALFILRRAL